MELQELNITGYAPFTGNEGVEGLLVRTDNGKSLLLRGPVVLSLLGAPLKRKRKQSENKATAEELTCSCGFEAKSPSGLTRHRNQQHRRKKEARR